jgi:polyphosphate kinase
MSEQSRKRKKRNNIIGGFFNIVNSVVETLKPDDSSQSPRRDRSASIIEQSNYISRDLSWLKFDERVLDQARNPQRSLMDRLKFLAITASNLDEFFTIRVGSLFNYLDYGRERTDYSGLREMPFKRTLFGAAQRFYKELYDEFRDGLLPLFPDSGLRVITFEDLDPEERQEATDYFNRTVYPMLTPMVFDQTHTFPSLLAKTLIFGVVTKIADEQVKDGELRKISFVQIPQNLPRFYVFDYEEEVLFLPIEDIIRYHIHKLYRNVEILSVMLFRITRNGDFDVEHEDAETDFIDEVKQKIKDRRLGRVTRIEAEEQGFSEWFMETMLSRWDVDRDTVFVTDRLVDLTCLWQILRHPEFKGQLSMPHLPVKPLGVRDFDLDDMFETIRQGDIMLHHPYNNFEPVLRLLEQAAEDPQVLALKITLYRISKNSRIANALLKAAENGKHVSVLFEVKARFDEENNIREAQRLQKAGCFVIYGIPRLKTHTKLLQVIRNEGDRVVSYAHLSSGNYNEDTAKLYTDVGLLTTDEVYTRDISEFFNVITGHSQPSSYQNLITAPRDMRKGLVRLIRQEGDNAQAGITSGICLKINSLQDKVIIDELYRASKMGVPIKLIIRGVCCLRPQRQGLSDNIEVRSIVGDFLEHTRLFYFHNGGDPLVYGGSADVMVRSFDRRIESLFLFQNPKQRQQAITILDWNLRDNFNTYVMKENGNYEKCAPTEPVMNIHRAFFEMSESDFVSGGLF